MGIKERKEREKRMRRQDIQKAAKILFTEKGYTATTMEDIAEKAELSPATIYQYFKNKQNLYSSLNVKAFSGLLDETRVISSNHTLSPEEKIVKFKDAMYKVFLGDALFLRNILHMQLEGLTDPSIEELLAELNLMFRNIMAEMVKIYDEGVQRGIFREGSGIGHADIMWGMFCGIMVLEEAKKTIKPKNDFFKTTLDQAFDIFLRGIKKGENESP
ncbi:MAG: TetR/AcrR family transcriptional regulator [Desulfatiglans sp.]|nr:TetR/AcrR family transcriptional regulator [Desulfatiglans sp.]